MQIERASEQPKAEIVGTAICGILTKRKHSQTHQLLTITFLLKGVFYPNETPEAKQEASLILTCIKI